MSAADVVVTRDPDVVRRADKIVVPGQGAFGVFMRGLDERGLGDVAARGDRARRAVPRHLPRPPGPVRAQRGGRLRRASASCAGEVDAAAGPTRSDAQDPAHGLEPASRAQASRCSPASPDGAYVYFVHCYRVVPADPSVVALEATHGVHVLRRRSAKDNLFACSSTPRRARASGSRCSRAFAEAA